MSFNSKEKLMEYLYKTLCRFNISDFNVIGPEYFETSMSSLKDGLLKRKLRLNKKNISELLMLKVKKDGWKVSIIVSTVLDLELDYMINYSNRFEWTANTFVGNSTQKEISDLSESIRATIRKEKQDASVLVKDVDDFFWISISMKNLKKTGIFEKPHYFVLTTDGRYLFTKDNRCVPLIKYITQTLGYEKERKKKLSGKSLQTLLKLLNRKENADMSNRPVYEGGGAMENEVGLDFTQKKHFIDYYNKCVDDETDIDLQHYTVSAVNCPWMGDCNPLLRDLEFKSAVTFSGNVARIIRQLPITSIVKPPFPNYLRNFSVCGRNLVSKMA